MLKGPYYAFWEVCIGFWVCLQRLKPQSSMRQFLLEH